MDKDKYIRIDSICKRQESIKQELITLIGSKSSFTKRTKNRIIKIWDEVIQDINLINTYAINNKTKALPKKKVIEISKIDILTDENNNLIKELFQDIGNIINKNKKRKKKEYYKKSKNELNMNNTPTTIDLKLIETKIKLAWEIYNECIDITSTRTHIKIIYDLLNYFEKITKIITKNMIGNKIANHDEQRRMVESNILSEIDKLNQIVETYEDESSNEDYANDE